MKQSDIIKFIISTDSNISNALKQMNNISHKILIVYENDRYKSLLTIGDIQRALINGKILDTPIDSIIRHNCYVANITDNEEIIKAKMIKERDEIMPVLDNNNNVVDIILWEDLFKGEASLNTLPDGVSLVVMAGGLGMRLRPLTQVIPKPLLPFENSTLIESIIDRFLRYNIKDVYIISNYKHDLLKFYLETNGSKKIIYHFIKEDNPLGTAGGLSLLHGINKTFFLSNSDIIIKEDYRKIYDFHKERKNKITIVGALYRQYNAYGILKIGANSELTEIIEKPENNNFVNTGFYIIEPEILTLIPRNLFLNFTDLIHKSIESNLKVAVFPINENEWIDLGDWKKYYKTINETN